MLISELIRPRKITGDVLKKRFSGLIVDDDKSVRTVLSARLEKREGYEIFEASDGVECLSMAKQLHPDFILLDWMMPGMDGLEVLEMLKAEPEICDIPVFMLTGKAKMKNVEKALDAGAEGYFTKPVKVVSIVKKIRALIGSKVEEGLES